MPMFNKEMNNEMNNRCFSSCTKCSFQNCVTKERPSAPPINTSGVLAEPKAQLDYQPLFLNTFTANAML